MKLEAGRFNDDSAAKAFFQLSERYGNDIYNFKGLSFHKAKYRGTEKSLYFASNNSMPSNDVPGISFIRHHSELFLHGRPVAAGMVTGLFTSETRGI